MTPALENIPALQKSSAQRVVVIWVGKGVARAEGSTEERCNLPLPLKTSRGERVHF